jgi:hypothetical protein
MHELGHHGLQLCPHGLQHIGHHGAQLPWGHLCLHDAGLLGHLALLEGLYCLMQQGYIYIYIYIYRLPGACAWLLEAAKLYSARAATTTWGPMWVTGAK